MPEPPLKITVATVCFNAADVIERTINSVEAQDYPHVEHLIVDGNSRDTTLQIVHRYQARNSVAAVPHEINCLSEPDEGLYDAMNKATGLATGDYILFLNAGDKFHAPTTLSDVATAAVRCGEPLPAVVYGDTDIVDGDGRFVRHRRLSPPRRLNWRSFAAGMVVCHQAFFARTDLARQTPYDRRYRFSADFDWCIRIMKKARTLHNTHLTLIDYLEEGMTTQNQKASLRERFRIMAKHYGLISTVAHHAWFVFRLLLKK